MARNRIVYAMWLVAVGFLHVFGNEFGTAVILSASVFIPLALIFWAWVASKRVFFELRAPVKAERGAQLQIHLSARGFAFLAGHVKCVLRRENLFVGEIHEEELALSHGGRSFSVATEHCGMYVFTLTAPTSADIFGLSAWKIKCHNEARTLVLPKPIEMQIETEVGTDATAESDEYSMLRPGNDPSDTHAIREYAPGDPLRSIHWKLSNKTDRLLVRELGLPVVKNILVLVTTTVPQGFGDIYRHANKVAEEAYSTCKTLLEDDTAHTLAWFAPASEKYESHEVSTAAEMDFAFARLLANTITARDMAGIQPYTEAFAEFGFSKIIVIGA
jgi:uncharacterized protein (DUF58 family)